MPEAGRTMSEWTLKNPFSARLLANHPLNADGSAKDTRHNNAEALKQYLNRLKRG